MAPFRKYDSQSPFHTTYKRVPGEGQVPAAIMLVGERPGDNEAKRGRPFVGRAGEYLNIYLQCANLERPYIYITNLVKDFRDYEKPSKEEIARDESELVDEIQTVFPRIIGLMGTFAVEWGLKRERAELERTHGVPVRAVIGGWECTALPMYHPAAGIYSPDTMANVLDDFLRLAQLAEGEIQVIADRLEGKEEYRTWPLPKPLTIVKTSAVDTEGSRKHPWCATVSTKPGTARLIKPTQQLLLQSDKVYLHNSLHDLGVLREMGIELGEDQFVDTMVLAYQLCIEPQGLKALAYRHAGMEMHSYEELVHEPNRTKCLDFLELVSCLEWTDPEPYTVIKAGEAKIKKPWNIKRLVTKALKDAADNKLDKDGNPVDLRERWGKWDTAVTGPVVEVLGDMPQATLDDVDPVKAEWYACRDADATLRIGPILEEKIHAMGLDQIMRIDHDILPMVDRMQQVGITLAPREFWDDIEKQCWRQMGKAKYEIYKLTGAEINPASGDQVAELLYGQLGLVPPKMTESGSRGSTNDQTLEALLGDAPVTQHIMDYREADKVRGTYAIPLRSLCDKGDRRVRATLRISRVETGRLSAANPNLLGIPILSQIGRQCRGGFVAAEGKVLLDVDLDQAEMRMMAHDSQDPELCRLFNEGRDVHSETAAKIFSVPIGSLSVDPHSGKVNDYRRTVAKHAGFGIINGITEHGLVNYMIQHRCSKPDGSKWTTDDCAELLKEWFNIYKGVKKFHNQCIAETTSTGIARETIGGRMVMLPAIWSPIKWIADNAARMSYVMHTQGGAQSLIKKAMKTVWDAVCKGGVAEPLLQVHDELLMEVPDNPADREMAYEMMVWALTTTTKLRVPVKASGGFGMTWLEAH